MDGGLLLLTVAGPDGPGITGWLMGAVAGSGARVADAGQAVTRGWLTLSVLVEPPPPPDGAGALLRGLEDGARRRGLSLSHRRVPRSPVGARRPAGLVLSCVAVGDLSAGFLADAAAALAGHGANIRRIDNSDPRDGRMGRLEVFVEEPPGLDRRALKARLFEASARHRVDLALLKDDAFRVRPRLVVLDMDSTLVRTEVIDEMARAVGAGDEVAGITARAMDGEVCFERALRERVGRLRGLGVGRMREILDGLELAEGGGEFLRAVKALGCRTALVSGGFTFFAVPLGERLGFDHVFANELEVEGGALTGRLRGRVVDAERKAAILRETARREGVPLGQVVAVGDGANDLPMLAAAGLGVAYHARDAVRDRADTHLSHGPMTSILHFLGIPEPPGAAEPPALRS